MKSIAWKKLAALLGGGAVVLQTGCAPVDAIMALFSSVIGGA